MVVSVALELEGWYHLDMSKMLPTKEDIETIARMLSIVVAIPAAIIVLVLAIVFSWSVTTALLVLGAFLGAVVLIIVVTGSTQALYFHIKKPTHDIK